jgi:hypothetical protein
MEYKINKSFFIDRDKNSHYYLINNEFREQWEEWNNLSEDDERSWNIPDFVIPVNKHPKHLTFSEPKLGDEYFDDGPIREFINDNGEGFSVYPEYNHSGGFYFSWLENGERWSTKYGWQDIIDIINEHDEMLNRKPVAWYVQRTGGLTERERNIKYGPFFKESEADGWVDENHTKIPLFR